MPIHQSAAQLTRRFQSQTTMCELVTQTPNVARIQHRKIWALTVPTVTKFKKYETQDSANRKRVKHFRTKHYHALSLCPDDVTHKVPCHSWTHQIEPSDVLMCVAHHFPCRQTCPSASRSRASSFTSWPLLWILVHIPCPSTEAMQLSPSQTTSTLPFTVRSVCSELSTVLSGPYCGCVHRSGRRRASSFLETNLDHVIGAQVNHGKTAVGHQSHDCWLKVTVAPQLTYLQISPCQSNLVTNPVSSTFRTERG